MTRKDYELIAKRIRTLPVDGYQREKIAQAFAESLKAANANFNPDLFIAKATR